MRTITVTDFEHWRQLARQLATLGTAPGTVLLKSDDGQKALFAEVSDDPSILRTGDKPKPKPFRVPRDFVNLAQSVSYHRDDQRWNLLYRILWRLVHDEPHLLEITTDDDVLRSHRMQKEVRRDAHKMKAFVRFRKVNRDGEHHFVAWHRPDHRIVRKVAPFFSRRFKAMNWTILTPHESVVWNQHELQYGPGVPRSEAPAFDELEDLWRTYYASIFNPARVKIDMMKSEMPLRYWDTMPETEIIADLLMDAPQRVEKMIAEHEGFAATALQIIQENPTAAGRPDGLRQLAAGCQACDLHRDATQTVFGAGPSTAKLVIVGEQPGDNEDLAGEPFVGPAGEILNDALRQAGIDRKEVYITNIVKHFKHTVSPETLSPVPENSLPRHPTGEPKGKKRLHQKPSAREVRCCRPWFDAEWHLLTQARVLVCLGATSASAILGPDARITRQRGQMLKSNYCEQTIATWHPAAILRMPDADLRNARRRQLVQDLALAARLTGG